MTELNTVDVQRDAPPARTAAENDIRPFRASISDEAVADLRRRLRATRWPDKETVADASQVAQ